MSRPSEPPLVNEHDEPVCPYDRTALDLHADGTWWCWKCGSEWDLDRVVADPVWRARAAAIVTAVESVTLAGDTLMDEDG